MFKKTLIAAAVATLASSVAMADVSISGSVEQGFTSTNGATSATDEWTGTTDANLVFKASEDLGNGMSAFAKVHFDVDAIQDSANTTYALTDANAETATAAAAANNTLGATSTNHNQMKDVVVGIKGGFGTVVLGRMEDFTTSKVTAMADIASGDATVEPDSGAVRNDNGVAYVSPAMNGLTLGVAGYVIDTTASAAATGTVSAVTASTYNDSSFDATDIALMYANGPLAINVSNEDHNVRSTAAAGTVEDVTAMGVSYAMGDLKVAAVYSTTDVITYASTDDTAIVASYAMGNNVIKAGWGNNESSTSAATVTDVDSNFVELNHNFSARTSAYVNAFNTDTANGDKYSVGLIHKF